MKIMKKNEATASNMQNIEMKATECKQDSVMKYHTDGLVVGSKRRKQMRENREKTKFHGNEVGFFKFKYSILKPILDFAYAIKQESIQLEFQEAGMHAKFLDSNHIVMGIFFIAKEEFIQYEIRNNEQRKSGIDVNEIRDLKIDPKDQIDVTLKSKREDRETEEYIIRYSVDEKTLKWGTSDRSVSDTRVPKIETYNYATLSPRKIYDFLKTVAETSRTFGIALTKSGIELKVKTTGAAIATAIPKEEMSIELTDEGSFSNYPIECVIKAFRAMRNATMVKISLGQKDTPMQIDFYIGRKEHETESTAKVLVARGEY